MTSSDRAGEPGVPLDRVQTRGGLVGQHRWRPRRDGSPAAPSGCDQMRSEPPWRAQLLDVDHDQAGGGSTRWAVSRER